MQSEMFRTANWLRMHALSKPYFISYTLRQGRVFVLHAAFGALLDRGIYPYGRIKVQVRTGNAEFDDTHFIGRDFWNYGPPTGATTFEPQQQPIRYDFWSLSDQA